MYRVPLPSAFEPPDDGFSEFANCAAQVTIKLKDGRIFERALSNGEAIIAVRGHKEPPFVSEEIEVIYQSAVDMNPKERSEWEFWDKWK